MNTANYINSANRYPVSTETLNFIQEQIFQVYRLAELFGRNYILLPSTVTSDGLVVVEGELMPLKAGVARNFIAIRETREDIRAANTDFLSARVTRVAEYTLVNEGDGCYPASRFASLRTISGLAAAVDLAASNAATAASNAASALETANAAAGTAAQTAIDAVDASVEGKLPPKGAIMDYYQVPSFANLPGGWVPCGFYRPIVSRETEVANWQTRYGTDNITFARSSVGDYLRIESCNGVVIPDLTGRFIVTAGRDYDLGECGGSASVVVAPGLSVTNNIALTGNNSALENDFVTDVNINPQVIDNRPPYYSLYKIIKVI